MERGRWAFSAIVVGCLAAQGLAQGGGGGFGGGGFAGAPGGRMQDAYAESLRSIDQAISIYLTGEETRTIVTPGEYAEWPLKLKKDQVVLVEARSDAFDPALQVVDAKDKVLAANDDRYPGDQRPLLLWRCEADGNFNVRLRCFRDKSGGQAFVRMRVIDSFSLAPTARVQEKGADPSQVLLRVPMKAGQVKQVTFRRSDGLEFPSRLMYRPISPLGLPNMAPPEGLQDALRDVIIAPVDGDYYCYATLDGSVALDASAREIPVTKLTWSGKTTEAKTSTTRPALWSLPVKAGDLLEVSASLDKRGLVVVAAEPDFAKYDLARPESNPFFPQPAPKTGPVTPPLADLPNVAWDKRSALFAARQDGKVWIAAVNVKDRPGEFTLTLRPGAQSFADGRTVGSRLRIGRTDWWAYDAKVGDVMSFVASATGFAQHVVLWDPDYKQVREFQSDSGEDPSNWSMIIRKPGRYLVGVACVGDGGSGPYSVERKSYPPKPIKVGSPAKGVIDRGETHVWKFTAKPDEPLYIHWQGPRSYRSLIQADDGQDVYLPLNSVDAENMFGILIVAKPTTYVIVLDSAQARASYSIELSPLPGYVKKKS